MIKNDKEDSNIGQTGIESIRLGGKKIENLKVPIEAIIAQRQMQDVIENDRQNKIGEVKAKFPKQNTNFLKSKVEICRMNIRTIKQSIENWQREIISYKGFVMVCQERDKLLKSVINEEERKEVECDFPPYKVDALEQQISQFEDSIKLGEATIDREHSSIEELMGVIAQCEERDRQLRELGETV